MALFRAILLFLVTFTVDARRTDYTRSMSPRANTHWGTWGPEDWCLEGSYAYGFSLKVEGKQGGGDDTALNGIKLLCRSFCGAHGHDITSDVQKWGKWKHNKYCPGHYFLKAVSMRSERPQHGGDDTAANNFNFVCESSINPALTYQLRGHGMTWGTWSNRVSCPRSSYICGIKTRVEKKQFGGDDTALNQAIFYCCSLDPQRLSACL